MRLGLMSDLHQEFAPFEFEPEDDIFYLNAGDTQSHTKERHRWLAQYEDIMFTVNGNHDYYLSVDQPEDFPDVRVVNGVKIAGATMWTDLSNYNDWMLYKAHLIDCHFIPNWDQLRYNLIHATHRKFLLESGADIIVTHHAPSFLSVHKKYQGDSLNMCYATELFEILMDMNNPPKLWLHGHMHMPADYTIGKTRIICHPRGYTHEIQTHVNYRPLIIDI